MEDQENNNSILDRSSTDERKQRYRELLNQIEEIHESNDVGLQTARKIHEVLSEINSLVDQCDLRERVTYPEEMLLDSLVLSSTSNALVKCTKAVEVFAATYEPLEFGTKVAETIKSDENVEQLDFLKLLEDARDIVPNTIEYSFLYGTYDYTKLPEPVEKKQRIKEKQELAPKKELINVQNTHAKEEVDEDSVMFLLKVLQNEYKANNEKPLKYYDFVIDSNNYGATVANMFYFSFLLRDGKAMIDIDDTGVPIVKPVSRKDLKSFRHNNGVNTQMITSIDMDKWDSLRSNKQGYVQRNTKSLQG